MLSILKMSNYLWYSPVIWHELSNYLWYSPVIWHELFNYLWYSPVIWHEFFNYLWYSPVIWHQLFNYLWYSPVIWHQLFHWKADFWKTSKPCHVGIHWIALAEFSQVSTHMPGLQLFFPGFLHHFVLAKLATSNKRVNSWNGPVA